MYDSESEIKQALQHIDHLQDKLQELHDNLSQAVENGKHAVNVERLEAACIRAIRMREVAHCDLTRVKQQIQDVLSAEKQFLEEVE